MSKKIKPEKFLNKVSNLLKSYINDWEPDCFDSETDSNLKFLYWPRALVIIDSKDSIVIIHFYLFTFPKLSTNITLELVKLTKKYKYELIIGDSMLFNDTGEPIFGEDAIDSLNEESKHFLNEKHDKNWILANKNWN